MDKRIEKLTKQLNQITLQQEQIIQEINDIKEANNSIKKISSKKEQTVIKIGDSIQALTKGKSNISGGIVTKIGQKFITFRAEDGRLHYRMAKNLKIINNRNERSQ